jgi:amphi-Trp domain-containing protein
VNFDPPAHRDSIGQLTRLVGREARADRLRVVVAARWRRGGPRARVGATGRSERGMELEIKEKSSMSREQAAGRLRAIADELASGNGIVLEREGLRFVAKVPDEVALKVEFEVDDDETEFEIELTW